MQIHHPYLNICLNDRLQLLKDSDIQRLVSLSYLCNPKPRSLWKIIVYIFVPGNNNKSAIELDILKRNFY